MDALINPASGDLIRRQLFQLVFSHGFRQLAAVLSWKVRQIGGFADDLAGDGGRSVLQPWNPTLLSLLIAGSILRYRISCP